LPPPAESQQTFSSWTAQLDHEVSPIPVIDDDRHVVGIVSEGEPLGFLLRAFSPVSKSMIRHWPTD
jgi:hypothetical protein